ncbi:leukocyte cell-derived chemotaxin-2-like [Carassius auratus]|uniref:Leukocyte cell-derived chemotaxin-2-like n=1 Tax=Carassius auratus TaxID=7957 RepID=A0A6P6QSP9_CARAU|nr:leukocyte cell-derived chemotaxin-2-like [Carassius auratus]XP_052429605.1 leukocyte cell-derived chemotaxin-2 [Carassius gibelio]
MKLYILFSFLLLAVICSCLVDASQVKLGPLCNGNSKNRIRGCDGKYGCGYYGASRDGGKRKHQGVDIVCADGATVYAPFNVKLNGKAAPYKKNNAINDGINLSGEGLCFKLFYVKPIKYSGTLRKGQKIGTMLPMQKVYPGITSHLHFQMCDKSDPTKYF